MTDKGLIGGDMYKALLVMTCWWISTFCFAQSELQCTHEPADLQNADPSMDFRQTCRNPNFKPERFCRIKCHMDGTSCRVSIEAQSATGNATTTTTTNNHFEKTIDRLDSSGSKVEKYKLPLVAKSKLIPICTDPSLKMETTLVEDQKVTVGEQPCNFKKTKHNDLEVPLYSLNCHTHIERKNCSSVMINALPDVIKFDPRRPFVGKIITTTTYTTSDKDKIPHSKETIPQPTTQDEVFVKLKNHILENCMKDNFNDKVNSSYSPSPNYGPNPNSGFSE